MNITVYPDSYDWLFQKRYLSLWAMGRWEPKCKVGDWLYFRWHGKLIARAKCSEIRRPNEGNTIKHDGERELKGWKVLWHGSTFEDLRGKPEIVVHIELELKDQRRRRKSAGGVA